MRLSAIYQLARYLVSPRTIIHSSQAHAGPLSRGCLASRVLFQSLLDTNYSRSSRANMSMCRQNYTEECEAGVNRQINMELYASYVYSSMAFHFDRDDVALPGFHKFFKKLSDEEREHAEKLMKYQNMRGGRVVLQDIKKPEVDEWGTGLEAMLSALKLEKHVNQSLLDLHQLAESKNDVQLDDFLEDEYLKEQVETIKKISDYVTQLNRVGPGLGEYLFDRESLQESL